MMLASALSLFVLTTAAWRVEAATKLSDTIVLKNDQVLREMKFDGHVWRTTRFARADGSDELKVDSDEFKIVMMDGKELTLDDYELSGEPGQVVITEQDKVVIPYVMRRGVAFPTNAPHALSIRYTLSANDSWTRKTIILSAAHSFAIDRLDVERFSVKQPASRGGRGEPVFVNNTWFFGVEYPAAYSRHTDGNTPVAGNRYYDKVGFYSDIQLEGHDVDANSRPGLIRLFHFPGYASDLNPPGRSWSMIGKTAVAGVGNRGDAMEVAFRDYLQNVAQKSRSFTHYNNWFDGEGKNLSVESWTRIAREFNTNIAPYGIKLDAMVFDDGWQNPQSIWQPGKQFAGGIEDIAKMGTALRAEGTTLGLWLALNGTMCDTKWGEQNGYARAKANAYFSPYFSYYSLSHPKYRAEMLKQLLALIKAGQLSYMKHDFNHLCDVGEGNGHPATDRHGHEANVDAMIEMILGEREANPDIYLNLTNWMWFSPWWLMYGNSLWMLAGDDGFNRNTPDISSRQMATTDRDTYIWRMWNRADERPLVPISHLMTHGIIRNPRGQMEGPGDTIRDFSDYVMMYYGRGSEMKEWYITPRAMTPDHWKVLGHIHRWAQRNFKALCNTVIVGGRPDEGNAYGYIGWDRDHGVLVARNTSVEEKTLTVPFDQTTFFRGAAGRAFCAKVVYPYQDGLPVQFTSGEPMTIEIPAFTTLTMEIDPGEMTKSAKVSPSQTGPVTNNPDGTFHVRVPAVQVSKCDLLVIGYPQLPAVQIDGNAAKPSRTNEGQPNQFAGFARPGMPSDKARPWKMASYDLAAGGGREAVIAIAGSVGKMSTMEAWVLLDRTAGDVPAKDELESPWALAQNERRETICLMAETNLPAAVRRAVSEAELFTTQAAWIGGEAFGVNGGEYGEKEIYLNGQRVSVLPVCGDGWTEFEIELDGGARASLRPHNEIVVRTNGSEDSFKFRELVLSVLLADGKPVSSRSQEKAQTSMAGWVHFEGEVFEARDRSRPVTLDFN